ncbi:MAG: bifunctional adenosylcobinamide kinase/adenosylcobinamide-phosphate guanylyltransferase [Roseburia sp.]
MFYLILGGSGSGKSAYAENLVVQLAKEKERVYLATMQVYGEEGKKRVERHRKLREKKAFHTVEQTRDLQELMGQFQKEETILLECMSNLTANEMFRENGIEKEDDVVEKVVKEVLELEKQVKHLVVVSNNVFEDGILYDEETMAYLRALGRINRELTDKADVVTEVVYTVPVMWKDRRK